MHVELWLMWIGVLANVFILTLQGLLLDGSPNRVISVSLFLVTIVSILGIVAFTVNSIPFGLDQMPEASAEQITAFIHWFVWSMFAGIATGELLGLLKTCTELNDNNTRTLLSFNVCFCIIHCPLYALCFPQKAHY